MAATRQQLEAAIVRAGRAGDMEAVKALGAQLRALPAPPKPPPRNPGSGIGWLDRGLSSANELLIGAASAPYKAAAFFTDPVARFANRMVFGEEEAKRADAATQQIRKNVTEGVARRIVSRPDPVNRERGEFLGSLVAPLPKVDITRKAAPVVAKYAQPVINAAGRAVQGAWGGAGMGGQAGSPNTEGAFWGAGVNALLPPVLQRAAKTQFGQGIIRGVSNLAKPLLGAGDEASEFVRAGGRDIAARWRGEPPPILLRPSQQLPPLGGKPVPPSPLTPLGPEAAERAEVFRKAGVERPTTGMVSRDPHVYSFEENTAKNFTEGSDLALQIREVEDSLVRTGKDLLERQGGAAGEEATGLALTKALDDKQKEMQEVTRGLYTQVQETRGNTPVGAPSWLMRRLDQPDVTYNPTFDQIREGVMRFMKGNGLTGDSGLMRGGAVLDVNQAEELRKLIGGLGNGMDPNVRRIRAELIDALDDDVVEGLGDDAFKAARASARARFDEFKKTFAGKIAGEGIAPERLPGRIMLPSTSLGDLRSLRRSLLTGTKEQRRRGLAAWRQLRGQEMKNLLAKSIDDDGRLKGAKLFDEVLGSENATERWRELLRPADFRLLVNLAKATRYAKALPRGHSVNVSNTAPTLANMFATMPASTKKGWTTLLKRLAVDVPLHLGATAATGGVPGAANVAVGVLRGGADVVVATAAQQRAAAELMTKIEQAANPQEAAAALAKAQRAYQTDAAMRQFFDRQGMGGLLGASTAEIATPYRERDQYTVEEYR